MLLRIPGLQGGLKKLSQAYVQINPNSPAAGVQVRARSSAPSHTPPWMLDANLLHGTSSTPKNTTGALHVPLLALRFGKMCEWLFVDPLTYFRGCTATPTTAGGVLPSGRPVPGVAAEQEGGPGERLHEPGGVLSYGSTAGASRAAGRGVTIQQERVEMVLQVRNSNLNVGYVLGRLHVMYIVFGCKE